MSAIPPSAPHHRVLVVGGGFSGAAVALRLLHGTPGPLAVTVVEPRPILGGGVAYSATDPAHRINVPAARMSLYPEDLAHFDRWLRAGSTLSRDPRARWGEDAYPARAVFGRYVADTLAETVAAAAPRASLQHRRARAVAIRPSGTGFSVTLDDGAILDADAVVLAVSHPPPTLPAALHAALAAGGRIVADPWADGAMDAVAPDHAVLVLGTGLSMADVIGTLHRRGHRGPVLALSRRGLLSREHPPIPPAPRDHFATAIPPLTAGALCRAIRREVDAAAATGTPWHAVLDDVRRHARRLWDALDRTEKRRVLRHLRPFWDVHRFRVAPQLAGAIAVLRSSNQLRVLAARIVSADAGAGGVVRLRYRERGGGEHTFLADAVINTTGPGHRAAIDTNPALHSLFEAGLLRDDGIGLGLLVDEDSRAIGAADVAHPALFVSGPLARGRFGELMGLPQVAQHAADVAAAVLRELDVAHPVGKARDVVPGPDRGHGPRTPVS